MKLWCTEIWAIPASTIQDEFHPRTYQYPVVKFEGPNVPGINVETAQKYCENNGLGYCKVVRELIAEIPCKDGTLEPDFSNMMDYANTQNN